MYVCNQGSMRVYMCVSMYIYIYIYICIYTLYLDMFACTCGHTVDLKAWWFFA